MLCLFEPEIHEQLQMHKGYFPTRKAFKRFLAKRFHSKLSNDHLSAARNGRPVARLFLVRLVVYLSEETDFFSECFEPNLSDLSESELVDRCLRAVPDSYHLPSRGDDLLARGPEEVSDVSLYPARYDKSARAATLEDLDDIACTFCAGLVDYFHRSKMLNSPISDFDKAVEEALEIAKLGQADVRELFAESIKGNPNSVWIEKKPDPKKHLLTHVISMDHSNYQKFLAGEIDDIWLAYVQPQDQTSDLLITSIFGDLRNRDIRVPFRMMRMVFSQIARMSRPIHQEGLRLYSFNCCELSVERLLNWGFEATGGRMMRTEFPLMKLGIEPWPVGNKTKQAAALWSLIFFFQKFTSTKFRKDRQAS